MLEVIGVLDVFGSSLLASKALQEHVIRAATEPTEEKQRVVGPRLGLHPAEEREGREVFGDVGRRLLAEHVMVVNAFSKLGVIQPGPELCAIGCGAKDVVLG